MKTVVYLFAKVCLNKMFVHVFFCSQGAHSMFARCWNALSWKQGMRSVNLQVEYPKTGTELCFTVTLYYTAEYHVPARQVWQLHMLLLHLVQ